MKYPAIVENNQLLFVAFSRHCVVAYNGTTKLAPDYTDADKMRNVTAEYLANTYGEVKSKEHAEFIVKLCEGTEIDTITMGGYRPESTFFNIYKEGDVTYLAFWDKESACITEGEKKITIPLPPECDTEDEWPKVGSKVLLNNDNDYELDYGEALIGKEVEVINLFTDGDLEMAVVKHDVANYCFRIEMLSKPKSKEEKDRDEIKEEIKDIFREAMKSPFWFIYDSDEQAANYLLERFDINKKPQ